MKKFALMMLATGAYAASAFAGVTKTVTVTTTGGGPKGYENVKETHTETKQVSYHSLQCYSPGDKHCVWRGQPVVVNNTPAEVIQTMVEAQLATGILQGSGSVGAASYTYEGLNSSNYNLTISGIEQE